jgi:hypothetical protein
VLPRPTTTAADLARGSAPRSTSCADARHAFEQPTRATIPLRSARAIFREEAVRTVTVSGGTKPLPASVEWSVSVVGAFDRTVSPPAIGPVDDGENETWIAQLASGPNTEPHV